MSLPWDYTNPKKYTNSAQMSQSERRSWYEAGKPPLARPAWQPQPKSAVAMNREAQAGWDNWAKTHVNNGLYELSYIIGEETAKIENRLNRKISELERELGQLRAARTVERSAEVFDIPDWRRRKRNAA